MMTDFLHRLRSFLQELLVSGRSRLVAFVLTLVLGALAVKLALRVFRRLADRSRLRGAAANFLVSLARVVLSALYGIILLSVLGVDTTSLVALFSVLTLAISLAVQGVISHLASGMMLVVTKPFEEGDFVDVGGAGGTVEHIHITCTKLRTPDNKIITIPNGSITSSTITNYSAGGTRRLDMSLSVAYGTDVALVKRTVLAVIARHGEIFDDPPPMVRLSAHGAYSLDFTVRVWLLGEDYWPLSFDLREEIHAAFRENGIEIPFPRTDVRVVK